MAALETERIFGRTWQWFCRAEQVAEPGDYVAGRVGREPVVVVRDLSGCLRAFSNVCRHRAGPVATGEGQARLFRCAYHGWNYTLTGELLPPREFAGVEDFDPARHCLPTYRAEAWERFVFVNRDPNARPLDHTIGPLRPLVSPYRIETLRHHSRRSYEIACNWKAYVDNYLEAYHVPVVHPVVADTLEMGAYTQTTWAMVSRQVAVPRNPRLPGSRAASLAAFRRLSPPLPGLTGRERMISQFFTVFPNWMLQLNPDHISTIHVEPAGPERCYTTFDFYFPERPGGEAENRAERLLHHSLFAATRLAARCLTDDHGAARYPGRHRPASPGRTAGPDLATVQGRRRRHLDEIARALNVHYTDVIQGEDIRILERVQEGLRSGSYDRGRFSVRRENAVHHFQGLVSQYLGAVGGAPEVPPAGPVTQPG